MPTPKNNIANNTPDGFLSHRHFDAVDDGVATALKNGTKGADLIACYVNTLTPHAGVYRMLDKQGVVLYVGKAKNLKKRVANYTQPDRNSLRIQRMISQTHSMEFVITDSDVGALLLEATLIKSLKPRYNVLLKDDKSFPHILIRTTHDYPQIIKHRGALDKSLGQFFGPFANAGAVTETIETVQKAFMLRDCTDHTLATRTRPCLQYQIKRCSAPCVGKISTDDYAQSVRQASDFLRGNGQGIIADLTNQMTACAERMEYEQAGILRDRIRALSFVQGTASHATLSGDNDVFAIAQKQGQVCIQVFFYRDGVHFGNKAWFPNADTDMPPHQILQAFMGQFYQSFTCPKTVLVNTDMGDDGNMLAHALSVMAEKTIQIIHPKRGDKHTVVQTATTNAEQSLVRALAERKTQQQNLNALGDLLNLPHPPERVEIYDNSHTQGASPVGAMVVAGADGFIRGEYRKFNIKNTDNIGRNNDDFAMMREVLTRRFKRAIPKTKDPESIPTLPDIIILDGGKGQLSAGQDVLNELGLSHIAIMGIAKGNDRESGRERLIFTNQPEKMLPPHDPLAFFLQNLRDESHRYVIGTHRKKRTKDLLKNPLDQITGIGAKRRKALLLHFGNTKNIAKASPEQIKNITGISKALAEKILQELN